MAKPAAAVHAATEDVVKPTLQRFSQLANRCTEAAIPIAAFLLAASNGKPVGRLLLFDLPDYPAVRCFLPPVKLLFMPSAPTRIDGPVAVIGDVHGQVDKLRRIIEKLATVPNVSNRWIVFIGDLVDRGPNSKGAIDLYCDLEKQHRKVTWVCGNHELAMAGSLGLIDTPDFIDWPGRWLPNYDSDKTFASYGVEHGDLDSLREALPERHREILSDLPWSVEHSQYLFVHAGLDVNLPFDTQVNILRQRDYTLAHPPWLYDKSFVHGSAAPDCPVTVVVGHTPLKQVRFGDRVIGTDTTGGVFGELSCVLLPENIVITSGDDPPPNQQAAAPTHGGRRPWWKIW